MGILRNNEPIYKRIYRYCPYPECGMPYDSSEFPDMLIQKIRLKIHSNIEYYVQNVLVYFVLDVK